MQRKHLVPRKNVIRRPVLREIRVFHCADAYLRRDVVLLLFAQVRIFFVDDFPGAPTCFLEKVAQRDILARARLHQLPVFAKNIAEYYVAEIGSVTFTPTDLENLFEM